MLQGRDNAPKVSCKTIYFGQFASSNHYFLIKTNYLLIKTNYLLIKTNYLSTDKFVWDGNVT